MKPYSENQDWQRECTKCGKVKCPKVEKVAEWMRAATDETFKYVEYFAREDPRFGDGLRSQAGKFSVMMELHMVSWSRCLEGVCMECQPKAFPEEHERLDDPEGLNAEHWRRWAFAAPLVAEQKQRDELRAEVLADVESFGEPGKAIAEALRPPATVKIRMSEGEKEAPCAWSRGGLAVVMLGEGNLEKAKADRAAGNADAYPTQAWSVTHVASGLAVASSYDMPDDAVRAARRFLPLVDWTQPYEKVCEAMKANKEARSEVALERIRTSMW